MLSYIECIKFNYVKEAEIPEQGGTLTLKGPGIFTVFHVGDDLKLQIGM